MKISRRLFLLFAGSVLLPGLILAYMSFRSVKDEGLLLEKSLEARQASFAEAMAQLLRKTRETHLDRLREQLLAGGPATAADTAWTLASRLLENPLVHSLVVFQGDTAVFPRSPALAAEAETPESEVSGPRRAWMSAARQEWRARRYGPCLRALRPLLHGPDSLRSEGPEASRRLGFRLLELKCLVRLGEAREAADAGREYIAELRRSGGLASHYQAAFYLSEAVNLLTALESLPRETREELFALHQQLPLFLSNADFVQREWPAGPEDILRGQAPAGDSLKVQYHEGVPYLVAGFPWTARETRILMRLNEGVFTEALRSEMLPERRDAGWKEMDFAIINRRDETVLASGPADGEPALEKALDEDFPAWRLVVFRKPPGEMLSLGRKRIALQYTLLGFSLLALLLGTLLLFRGLEKEQRMVRMKGNFLSAVSHELKTPLTAIRMFAEMLASGRQAQEEKRRQYVQRIGEEAERLQGMIEGILSYTRLEEDPEALRLGELDLCELAREAAALLDGAFVKAGIRLDLRLPPAAPLRADYDALRSVVQNLLENSLKYSRTGTEVVLEVRVLPGRVLLRVADQGVGISPEDLKHIFDKFYRAGDELTRKTRGSGIGLALVKRIVEAHGGTIQVNSRMREGTEMLLTFPIPEEDHAPDTHR